MNKVYCEYCRKEVEYTAHSRNTEDNVEGVDIEYIEEYATCDECHEEIYVGVLHDKNLSAFNKVCEEKGI